MPLSLFTMNTEKKIMGELRDAVSKNFPPVTADAIRAAFNSLTTLGGTQTSVMTKLSEDRTLFVSDAYEMSITAARGEKDADITTNMAKFLKDGESATDQVEIDTVLKRAVENHWTNFTIRTDTSLYYLRYGNLAGHWKLLG